MINPRAPAAVISGNTKVSQAIADTLYGALGVIAGSQGTMTISSMATTCIRITRRSAMAPAQATGSMARLRSIPT